MLCVISTHLYRYLVPKEWLEDWRKYMDGGTKPGPIDLSPLLDGKLP